MRFYAACLASYNNGVLHGIWVDASDDIDAMQATINAMLRSSRFPNVTVTHPETGESVPSAEEWAIHDHEGFGELAEYAGLAKVAEIVAINDVAEERDIPLAVLQEAMSDASAEADRAEDFVDDRYRGKYDSWADFAEQFTEETDGLDGVPDHIRSHIDWASMGREFEIGGDFNHVRHDGQLYIFWNH
jgi:antirestriction protein